MRTIRALTLCVIGVGFSGAAVQADQSPVRNMLPKANKLPINADTFCQGAAKAMASAKQNISVELKVLCENGVATRNFKDMISPSGNATSIPRISAPYNGTQAVSLIPFIEKDLGDGTTELLYGLAMKVAKPAVNTMLQEEKHASVPYDSESMLYDGTPNGDQQATMKMNFSFQEPPKNLGDADTTFSVLQTAVVNSRSDVADYTSVTEHELKQYLLHENNFDFFMAGRTLVQTVSQTTLRNGGSLNTKSDPEFKKSAIIRAFLADPESPADKAIVVTIAHLVIKNHGRHDALTVVFKNFLTTDVKRLFDEQAGK